MEFVPVGPNPEANTFIYPDVLTDENFWAFQKETALEYARKNYNAKALKEEEEQVDILLSKKKDEFNDLIKEWSQILFGNKNQNQRKIEILFENRYNKHKESIGNITHEMGERDGYECVEYFILVLRGRGWKCSVDCRTVYKDDNSNENKVFIIIILN